VARLVRLALIAILALGCAAPRGPAFATPTPVPFPGQLTRDDLQPAINAVLGDPVNFAGLWWDSSGWPLHIMYVSDDPRMRAKVEQWIPPGAPVAWHRVAHSYAELSEIRNELVSTRNADLAGQGNLPLNSVSVDVVRNVVTVSLVEHAVAFESPLRARYDDAIEFVIEPPDEPL
jgi:hypothetical protein